MKNAGKTRGRPSTSDKSTNEPSPDKDTAGTYVTAPNSLSYRKREWQLNYKGHVIYRGVGPLDMPKWRPYVTTIDGQTLRDRSLAGLKQQIDRLNASPAEKERYEEEEREKQTNAEHARAYEANLKAAQDKATGQILYRGHKGPGVGILRLHKPDARDGDGDTVVAERRGRKGVDYPTSPMRLKSREEIDAMLSPKGSKGKRGRATSRQPKGNRSPAGRSVVQLTSG